MHVEFLGVPRQRAGVAELVIEAETLGQLLVQVQIDREQPADVAQEFLESEGLL